MIFAPSQLAAILLRPLLRFLDDSPNHHLKFGGFNAVLSGGVVEVEQPFDRWQPTQPFDLDSQAPRAFLGVGEGDDDLRCAVLGGMLVHSSHALLSRDEQELGHRVDSRRPGSLL